MNAKLFKIGMGIFVFALIIILFVVLGNNLSKGDTRAGETYSGGQGANCGCHPEIVTNWSATDHADADGDFQNKHGTNVYDDSYCGPCHVLGYDEIGLGGFDPAEPWNSTNNTKMWMIQCENCHGPGSSHAGSMNSDDINIDRDPYTACGGTEYAACHNEDHQFGSQDYPGWNASAHAPWDDDPATDRGMNTYCARCKSPSQWDPFVSYQTAVNISIGEFRGITCGDCHNPHSVTPYKAQLKWDPELTCEQCHHGENHETVRNSQFSGAPSVNVDEYPYMDNLTCIDCHMFETSRSLPTQWRKIGHLFEASIEACVECHTDVYDNIPDADYDEGNATAMAEWDAWNETLQEALEEYGYLIETTQDAYYYLNDEVESLLFDVETLMFIAMDNGRWTPEMDTLYSQAEYDWELAEHQSKGAHNPSYTFALLNASKANLTIIFDDLSMGVLKGEVTNSSGPVSNVTITVNGNSVMTDSNGYYTLIIIPGVYTVTAFKINSVNQTATDVSIPEACITWLNFSIDEDFDNDGIPDSIDDDDDNDTYLDDVDAFPLDPLEWEDTDSDGLGDNADYDDDNDGYVDLEDAFPKDPTEWKDTDSDGIGDNADSDDDGDGVLDDLDAFPLDPLEWEDSDSDGTGNNADVNDDNDGYVDVDDLFPKDPTEWFDFDSDGIGDNADLDDDGDGILDENDAFPFDPTEFQDTDNDTIGDNSDLDDDGDGFLDENDEFSKDPTEWTDSDSDGIGNNADLNDDGDGYPDFLDKFPLDSTEWADNDKDGIGDNTDFDDDNDGHFDDDDYYPLDSKRWKKEEDVKSDSSILLVSMIAVIITAILAILFILRKMKVQPKNDGKSEKEDFPPPPPPE